MNQNYRNRHKKAQEKTVKQIDELHSFAKAISGTVGKIIAGHERINNMSPPERQEYERQQTIEWLRRHGVH